MAAQGKEWSKEEQALGLHGAMQVMLYDPAQLSAADKNVRATLDLVKEWMASGVPLPPAGAKWETMPAVSVAGFTVSVDGTGQASFQGAVKDFPAYSYTATAPGEGLLRLVVVYAKPDGTYGVSVGDAAQNPVQPSYPATALFVTMMVVAPTGGIIQQPTSYVTSVTVRKNGVDGPSQTGAVVVNLDELAPTQDIAYRPFPNTGAVTLNYATSPNWKGPAAGVTSVSFTNIPNGADGRIEFKSCAGESITLPSGQKDLNGEPLPALTLPASGDCFVLVNNTGEYLKWSVTGTGGDAFNIGALPALPSALVDTDLFAVFRNGVHYKTTFAALKTAIGSTGGGGGTDPVSTAPSITLLGDNPQVFAVNTPYVEQGATATDAEDGNLTSAIVISGAVDTATPAKYQKTYQVTDSGGLTATVKRDVHVGVNRLEIGAQGGIDVSASIAPFAALTDTVTIEGWVRPYENMVSNSGQLNSHMLFTIQNDQIGTGSGSDAFQVIYGNAIGALTNELITITRYDNHSDPSAKVVRAGYVVSSNTDVANKDIHWAVVTTATTWKLYINGVLVPLTVASNSNIGVGGFIGGLATMNYMHWGTRWLNGVRDSSLVGQEWRLRIWNAARTPTQIVEGMTASYADTEPTLLGQWLVDEGAGTVAEGANNYDGVIYNGTWKIVVPEASAITNANMDELIQGGSYTGMTLE